MSHEIEDHSIAETKLAPEAEAVMAETGHESLFKRSVRFAKDIGKIAVSGHAAEALTAAYRAAHF